jgi:hypothetical protein
MYRIVAMAVIALAAVALPAETSLAFGPGSGAGAFGAPIARIAPAASRVAPKPGGGPATPHAKKLSGKGGGVLPRLHAWGVRRGLGQFLRLFLLRPLIHRITATSAVQA